jgi:hypothetical protein
VKHEAGNLTEGAIALMAQPLTAQRSMTVRVVDHYPVVGHLCVDGTVRNVRLGRRNGDQPRGVCSSCQTVFQYRKPKPSPVRHISEDESDGA